MQRFIPGPLTSLSFFAIKMHYLFTVDHWRDYQNNRGKQDHEIGSEE